ncbi:MAG: aryl-sulfate sulfotransferase [Deltaproteobacteria bacterium]|nr:aryl-sulfate sulfotransferase [Deltaproteobacteria bacterium]
MISCSGELQFDEAAYARGKFESDTEVIFHDERRAHNGYTLICNAYTPITYLVDMKGRVVHQWPLPEGMVIWANFMLLENGHLIRAVVEREYAVKKGGPCSIIQEVDWDNHLLWEYRPEKDIYRVNRDMRVLPNGNILYDCFGRRSADEARAKGRLDKYLIDCKEVYPIGLVEVNRNKEMVWSWSFWDHHVSESTGDITDPGLLDINVTFFTKEADYLECNAIDYDPATDRIILNSAQTSEIYVIDHSTADYDNPARGIAAAAGPSGNFIARFGNPANYGAGKPSNIPRIKTHPGFGPLTADRLYDMNKPATNGDRTLFQQHGPMWIPRGQGLRGEGNILVFNNGLFREPKDYSTTEEYDCRTGKMVWAFEGKDKYALKSWLMGGAQRLSNGNTLICGGQHGHIYEVIETGEVVWEYIVPMSKDGIRQRVKGENITIYNARRYSPDYPGLAGRDLTPGATIAGRRVRD